ncbi:hypothetical protein MKW94_015052 [Papaver nudicaule]|uniref:Uncharacterized protein n=1 Tax=Papaver nudicaule TaxID=74823 RepID=A0AA41SE74_PAPNU|nr:hypothetical protein [Papaver nudicaule]MCL7033716.1 hypothetical protein [Papaver nudicaule]
MANKIHIFKKSAIEAGTPENYYLNPSDNLMKIASEWRVIEHEDFLTLTINHHGFGNLIFITFPENSFNIEVKVENKETGAARFDHQDGMKKFSIEMNPKFLESRIQRDESVRLAAPTQRFFITKLKK